MTTQLRDDDEVLASLAPFESLPAWLASAMDPARVGEVLAERVPELGERLLACRPERLRAKGEEWLARYRLRVVQPGGDESDVVLVGNLWPPTASPPPASRGVDDAARLGEPGWTCWLPELGLQLRTQTHDEGLPALPTLVEPRRVARLLHSVLPGAGYPDAVVAECFADVVRYKPGSRCTVVVHVDYEPGPGQPPPSPVVLKTHQGDKGRTAWAAMSALWERREAWQDAVTMAEPLAYLPEQRILVQGPVPELCTLKELARRAFTDGGTSLLGELRDELTKTATALAAVHASGAEYGRTATVEEEIEEIEEVVDRLARTVPQLAGAGRALLDRLAATAASTSADPAVPAHHDFRPAQVLLDGGRVGFIDFDGASMAEPALDLGRFRAKLRDIAISALAARDPALPEPELAHNLQLQDELCDHFLAAYLQHAPVSPDRVRLWESCDLLTAMLHAWTKVRTARLTPRLVVLRHQLWSSGLAAPTPTGWVS